MQKCNIIWLILKTFETMEPDNQPITLYDEDHPRTPCCTKWCCTRSASAACVVFTISIVASLFMFFLVGAPSIILGVLFGAVLPAVSSPFLVCPPFLLFSDAALSHNSFISFSRLNSSFSFTGRRNGVVFRKLNKLLNS